MLDTKEHMEGSMQSGNISTDEEPLLLLKQQPKVDMHTFDDEQLIFSLTLRYECHTSEIRNHGNPECELIHIRLVVTISMVCFATIIRGSVSDEYIYLVWLSWCICIISCLLYILSWLVLCHQDKIEKKYERTY